ncbi:TonB-dependent receptor plug domain-containing protein, partial [Caulobacter sp.]|uniref:TonB-dependent receptor plug domain-containing protein n=1 Tax=Caulobacter sp. TaxID=78 RepID=UPI001B253377
MIIDPRKALLGSGVALMALGLAGSALAQQRTFNIPAQDAMTAISQFGLQARVQITAPTDQLRGVRTRDLRGDMDVRRALTMLLRGTGLEVASRDGGVIVLRPARTSKSSKAGHGVGIVAGAVLDPVIGDYLRNAIIKIDGRQVATSGDRGEFRINSVPAGAVRLSVEFTGYMPRTVMVGVRAGLTTRQDIELRSSLPAKSAQEVTGVDEVVVLGAREGDARAIMEQRASMNIVNTLSADSFGEIGDGNPAEFLKYMPGVDFDVVADDIPRNISLRGLQSKYTRVVINGRALAGGTDANTSTTSPTSRQYSFEQLALTAIDSISVSKTTSADMDANAPAGTIDIRTRKAFDRKGRSITVQLGGSTHTGLWDGRRTGWQEGGYGGKRFLPTEQITYADVFLDGRLGVTAGLSDSTTLIEQEQTTAGRNYLPTAASPDPYAVTSIAGAFYVREYNRKSALLGLDFKATDHLILSLMASYNRGDIDSSTTRPTFTTLARGRGVVGHGDAALDFTTNAAETANTLALSNIYNYKVGTTRTVAPGFEWSREKIKADGYLFYSNSGSGYRENKKGYLYSLMNSVVARGNFSAVRSRLLDQDWKIRQISGPDWSDPVSYELGAVGDSTRPQVQSNVGSTVETDMAGGALNVLVDGKIGDLKVSWKIGGKFTRGDYDYADMSEALQWIYNGPLSNAEF